MEEMAAMETIPILIHQKVLQTDSDDESDWSDSESGRAGRQRTKRQERQKADDSERDRSRSQRQERENAEDENHSLEDALVRIQRLVRETEPDEIQRQKRTEDTRREEIWKSSYAITTLKRDVDRRYDLIDLQTSSHNQEVADDVFSAHRGRDLIFEMAFPLQLDYTNELELFSRLKRHGNFASARAMFKESLQSHMDHPFIFTLYAELLFEMGDYKSLRLLDPKPAFGCIPEHKLRPAAFDLRQMEEGSGRFIYQRKRGTEKAARQHGPNTPDASPAEDGTPEDLHSVGLQESRLLHLKWRLLESLAIFHNSGTVNEALADAKTALHSLVIHDEVGSTEVRLFKFLIRVSRPFRY
jgi:hypothetical protein